MARGDRTPAGDPAFASLAWRGGNALVSLLARAGVGPIQLLTTRGRRTGRLYTHPVVPVELAGTLWLVAPYGAVAWVQNARAAGRVRLRYGRRTTEYTVREALPHEAGPVLKRYVHVATKARSRFNARPDAPVEAFAAESGDHPVFELTPVE